MNDTTRRYPRTLVEAFGPYEAGPIEDTDRPLDWQDKLVIQACAVALVLLVVLL